MRWELAEEVLCVGQFRVDFEGFFVGPFGMDVVVEGFAGRLAEVDADAAWFGAAGRDDARQFFEEPLVFSGPEFEADENMERHGGGADSTEPARAEHALR